MLSLLGCGAKVVRDILLARRCAPLPPPTRLNILSLTSAPQTTGSEARWSRLWGPQAGPPAGGVERRGARGQGGRPRRRGCGRRRVRVSRRWGHGRGGRRRRRGGG